MRWRICKTVKKVSFKHLQDVFKIIAFWRLVEGFSADCWIETATPNRGLVELLVRVGQVSSYIFGSWQWGPFTEYATAWQPKLSNVVAPLCATRYSLCNHEQTRGQSGQEKTSPLKNVGKVANTSEHWKKPWKYWVTLCKNLKTQEKYV